MRELTDDELTSVAGGVELALDLSQPALGLGGLGDWNGITAASLGPVGPIIGPIVIGPTIAPVSGPGEERRAGS